MRKCFFKMALCVLAIPATAVLAELPTPAAAPVSWELRFRFQDPQRVSVVVPGQADPVVYWYMLYTVENPGDLEIDYLPRFELVTDTLKVVPSEVKVSPEAFQAIRRRSGDPLLLTPEKILGQLLCGKEHAKHGVAIWRDFDPRARAFRIYAQGLAGEMTRVKNPGFEPKKPETDANKRYFILHKTLEIPYKLPAGPTDRYRAIPVRQTDKQRWVMR